MIRDIRSNIPLCLQEQGSKSGWELIKSGCHVRSQELLKKYHIFSFQTNYSYYQGFYASYLDFYTNLAGNLHFNLLILAGGHLFLKLFQLASQTWLLKSQIVWEQVPTIPIFLEPCSGVPSGFARRNSVRFRGIFDGISLLSS